MFERALIACCVSAPLCLIATVAGAQRATYAGLIAGSAHGCAIRADRSVACWGANEHGQLGDGTSIDRSAPVAVQGLNDVVQLAAGASHTCARRAGGAVVCWGSNEHGQLGDGSTIDRSRPVSVAGLTDAAEIDVGQNHSCARRAGGSIVCWGSGEHGQLGDGTTTDRAAPTAIAGISDATQIAAGGLRSCVLRATGEVACWGHFTDEPQMPLRSATAVQGITDAVEITAGWSHACVRRTSGAVVCWGYNGHGRLGGGTRTARHDLVDVLRLNDAVEIAAGYSHTCARRANGTAVCWGSNNSGELGNGDSVTPATAPVVVADLADAIELAAGDNFTCALRTGGAIACWGANEHGQLGDGTTEDRSTALAPDRAPAPDPRARSLARGLREAHRNQGTSPPP